MEAYHCKIYDHLFPSELSDCQVSDNQFSMYFDGNGKHKPNGLRLLSLFSGCGGMDLGFEGGFVCHKKSIDFQKNWITKYICEDWVLLKPTRFEICFANDILKDAKTAWTHYFRKYGYDSDIFHQDSIVDLVKQQLSGARVFPENIDIVTGGFPCQDFSVAGKRLGFESKKDHNGHLRTIDIPTEESRGKLYFWMKQVIDITKPKIFVAENVKGLTNLGDVMNIIRNDFSHAADDGYIVLEPQILHAGNFGVPESRERVIIIGLKKNALNAKALKALSSPKIPEEYIPYPPPTHACTNNNSNLLPIVTCADVFKGLPEPENSTDNSQKVFSKAKYMGTNCQGQTEIKLHHLGPTIRSEHHGNIEFRRLSAIHGGTHTEELALGLPERRLTPRECALIQTFPPDYDFVWSNIEGGVKQSLNASGAYKIIGNAVPPVLAYNIAQRIQSIWPLLFE